MIDLLHGINHNEHRLSLSLCCVKQTQYHGSFDNSKGNASQT